MKLVSKHIEIYHQILSSKMNFIKVLNFSQYCLSNDAAKPCFVISFKEVLIMLDCGLSAAPVLSFLPLPPVPSTRLAALPSYTPPHVTDPALEGASLSLLN